eukprot:TRINITY_DN726_c0_g1_i13.p1 TRINITY_DN726_c0_g1~~TRINITY_DN726_c0_g1_i13.p1  ORF type:complete len:428 (-),score=33.33 TRINITY_DN726_c0_g1_i13:125-1408(-)
MCELYEVVVFTASTSNYATKVIDELDPEHKVPYRLFRQHCTLINCDFVKDLSQLGRDLKDVIIVDNMASCYGLQPCNGIPISTWIDDKSDKELDRLACILEPLSKVDDVRDYLREVVRDNELDYFEALRLLNGEVTLEEVQKNPSAYWTSPRKKPAPREHFQSNKNLAPYINSFKEDIIKSRFIDKSNISSDGTTADNQDPKTPEKRAESVSSGKAQGKSKGNGILEQKLLIELKESKKEEVKTVKTNLMSTPTARNKYRNGFNRMNFAVTNGSYNGGTYYKPVPAVNHQEAFTPKVSTNNEAPLNSRIPQRSSSRQYITSYTPKPIPNLSNEANKYYNKSSAVQEKPAHTLHRQSTCFLESYSKPNSSTPSYAPYLSSNPSLYRYPVRNGYMSSATMIRSYAGILGGSSTPARTYTGGRSSGVWNY